MAPVLVTLNDLEGHSPVAGLFKCNLSNICAVFYQISTDSALARSLATAGVLVFISEIALLWQKDYCDAVSSTNSSFFKWWNEVEQFSSMSSPVQT